MMFLYQTILGLLLINAVFGTMETDSSGFVKIDVFENSMNVVNRKFDELQKYVLEMKSLMDTQTEVNDIFRKQIVKLKTENARMKRRLEFVDNKSTRKSGVKKVIMDYENIDTDKNIPETKEVTKLKEVKDILNTSEEEISMNQPFKQDYKTSNIRLQKFQPTEEVSKISNAEINRSDEEMKSESKVSALDITTKFRRQKSTHLANYQNNTTFRKSDRHAVHLTDRIKQVSEKRENSMVHAMPVVDGEMQLTSRAIQGRQVTEPNESIAFSAFLQHDIPNLQKDQIIKFDGVLINDGNGYDVTTGIFTAPRSGLYLFSYAIEDYSDHLLWVYLRHDNKIRSSAVAKPYAEHQNVMGSNTLLLKVDAGSRVWISVYTGNRVQNDWTTFSGVLLH